MAAYAKGVPLILLGTPLWHGVRHLGDSCHIYNIIIIIK